MKWNLRMLRLAKEVSAWGKHDKVNVGAVITLNNKIISTGYQGYPANLPDDFAPSVDVNPKHYCTVHAEANAILQARCVLEGSILYSWPWMPCSSCACLIIQAGITKVVTIDTEVNERWKISCQITKDIFKETGVELIVYDGDLI